MGKQPDPTSRILYVWSWSSLTIQLLFVILGACSGAPEATDLAIDAAHVGHISSSSRRDSHLHSHQLIHAVPARQQLEARSSWRRRGEPVMAQMIRAGVWKPPAGGINTFAVGPGPSWYKRTASEKVAVVWISRTIDPKVAAFAEEVGSRFPRYDNIMVSDSDPEDGSPWEVGKVGNVTFVQVNATVANAAGFSHSHVTAAIRSKKRTLSQDKALFYLARVAPDPHWSHVWLVEDDVFVPYPSSFAYMDAKYPSADMLCRSKIPEQTVDSPAPRWIHWKYVQDVPPPRWQTLASAIRVSNRLLNTWLHFARAHGRLLFHEALPLTLAMNKADYIVENPEEIGSSFDCCNKVPPSIAAVLKRAESLPHTFWHRVKNSTMHQVYRDELAGRT